MFKKWFEETDDEVLVYAVIFAASVTFYAISRNVFEKVVTHGR